MMDEWSWWWDFDERISLFIFFGIYKYEICTYIWHPLLHRLYAAYGCPRRVTTQSASCILFIVIHPVP